MVTSLQVTNMTDLMHGQDTISALADGQLRGEEFARAVESATEDAQALATWHAYHVVGDVLRCGELAAYHHDVDFMARLKTRLRQEQIQVRAEETIGFVAKNAYPERGSGQNSAENRAANESIFRWKLVAGFASLAAVVSIGWNGFTAVNPAISQPQLAQAVMPVQPQAAPSAVAVADGGSAVLIRDPRLDAFLAAHEQFGGTSALQMPAGFFRNATFEGPTR
jgi:sigma-E factor negative regulatory protein RseA